MTALMERELTTLDVLVEQARTWTTPELAALYRTRRDMAQADAEFFGWADTRAAAARVLRERVAADWLHAVWCPVFVCPAPVEHLAGVADAARTVVDAFEAGAGFAEAVYRAMAPTGPMPVLGGTAPLSKDAAFLRLIADLVAVVPAEVTA